MHTSPHSIPSAAVVGTGGEQDRSSEASTETHIEDRVGDMDERISLELQQSMMEPPTKYKYLMESSAEEQYDTNLKLLTGNKKIIILNFLKEYDDSLRCSKTC
jgi:hypothetical protein